MAADDGFVIAAIVVARLALPLLIPRIPLIIIAALVLDAVDNSLLAHFSSIDPGAGRAVPELRQGAGRLLPGGRLPGDDAQLDEHAGVPDRARALLLPAAGVVAFELLDSRAMLLVFPNTCEFFFIAYEGLRTRWDPDRWSGRFWLYMAGGIWVFVKLPQEYWIHVAQLDFTDTVADHRWFGLLCLLGLGVLAWLVWFVVRPPMPEPLAGWRFAAPAVPATRRGARPACRGTSWPRRRSC